MAELGTPILNDIRNTNFFNGRLLTATDLRDQQNANRSGRAQLGRAIGAGIAHGLEVALLSAGTGLPTVTIQAGLALNRQGQALALNATIELVLTASPEQADLDAGLFVNCPSLVTDELDSTTGIFVLVMSPASGYQERAPMRSFDDGSVTGCGDRYAVEGVQFRLVELNAIGVPGVAELVSTPNIGSNSTALSQLRNLLAHFCFGTGVLATYSEDPFLRSDGQSTYASRGAIDQLRAQEEIGDCDVPLALLYWNSGTVHFVDNWAVRRRLIAPAADTLWPLHVGQRRPAEQDALFIQFQDHLEWLRSRGINLATIQARNYFRFLPPVGYLPINSADFRVHQFFDGLNTERIEADPAFLRLTVQQALWVEPIELTRDPQTGALTDDVASLLLHDYANGPGYVLFIRNQQALAFQPPDAADAEPAPPRAPGRITVDLVVQGTSSATGPASSTGAAAAARTATVDARSDIQVWAENLDKPNTRNVATFVSKGFSRPDAGSTLTLDNRAARFEIRSLPPGNYRVFVEITGFKDSSQTHRVHPGRTAAALFNLVRESTRPGSKPKRPTDVVDVTWLEPGVFTHMAIVDKALNWPWPPDPRLEGWPYSHPAVDPPPDAAAALQDVSDWIAFNNPTAPVDPGDIRIHVDPEYEVGRIYNQPYAYLVFGAGGAYAPVALTLADRSLPGPLSIRKSGLSGFDRELEEQLVDTGITRIDVLAAAWTGLLTEELGFSVTGATGIIADAIAKVDVGAENSLQDSLLLVKGVDRTVADLLAAAGIVTTADLANTSAAALLAELGETGAIDASFAARLVEDARSITPSELWALEDAGLTTAEMDRLRAAGIETQGMLNQLADQDANSSALRAVLPQATDAEVQTFKELTQIRAEKQLAARKESQLLLNIARAADVDISVAEAKALSRAGIRSVGGLLEAGTDIQRVAVLLEGDIARATELVQSVQGLVR